MSQSFSKIWIVVILVILIAGGILAWQYLGVTEEKSEAPERKVVVPSSEKDCQILEEPFYRNHCYIDLAKKTRNESYCERIEALSEGTIEGARSKQGVDCYIQLAILKNDFTLCEKAEFYEKWNKEFYNWCKIYFEEPSDFRIHSSEENGFEVIYPKDWKCDKITLGQGGYFYQSGISCKKITDVDGIRIWVLKSEPPYYFEKEEVTFEEYIAKEKQKIEKEWESVKEEEIVLDNLPAIKLTFESTNVTHYLTKYKANSYKIFVQKAGNMYIIEGTIDSSQLDIYNPVFNQLLSTFRFIEPEAKAPEEDKEPYLWCSDSAGGPNFYIKGSISSNEGTYTDECIDKDNLKEYFCTFNNKIGSDEFRCPNGCEDGHCINKPTITILSPNGGEEWEYGKIYTIKWKSEGINKVKIYLQNWEGVPIAGDDYKSCVIADNISASTGKYSWTIKDCPITTGDRFIVRITDVRGLDQGYSQQAETWSDSCFSIR